MNAVTKFAPTEISPRSERMLGFGEVLKAISTPNWVLIASFGPDAKMSR